MPDPRRRPSGVVDDLTATLFTVEWISLNDVSVISVGGENVMIGCKDKAWRIVDAGPGCLSIGDGPSSVRRWLAPSYGKRYNLLLERVFPPALSAGIKSQKY